MDGDQYLGFSFIECVKDSLVKEKFLWVEVLISGYLLNKIWVIDINIIDDFVIIFRYLDLILFLFIFRPSPSIFNFRLNKMECTRVIIKVEHLIFITFLACQF